MFPTFQSYRLDLYSHRITEVILKMQNQNDLCHIVCVCNAVVPNLDLTLSRPSIKKSQNIGRKVGLVQYYEFLLPSFITQGRRKVWKSGRGGTVCSNGFYADI